MRGIAQLERNRPPAASMRRKAVVLDAAEVYAMIDSLGDVGVVIGQARPESLAKLYRDLR